MYKCIYVMYNIENDDPDRACSHIYIIHVQSLVRYSLIRFFHLLKQRATLRDDRFVAR